MERDAERKVFLSRSLTNVHVPLSPLLRASFIPALVFLIGADNPSG